MATLKVMKIKHNLSRAQYVLQELFVHSKGTLVGYNIICINMEEWKQVVNTSFLIIGRTGEVALCSDWFIKQSSTVQATGDRLLIKILFNLLSPRFIKNIPIHC